jgi:GNAT superfamily N-acetyltransferase
MMDLVIRPLAAGEEPLFESLADPGLVGPGAFGSRYSDMAARGEYRPEWTWIASREGTVVARAAWWAGPDDDTPVALDWFDFTDPVIGYIAVVPERRGHGYAYDLLAEATHFLVTEGADRIVAGTDVTNTPMAAAFTKAGYPVAQHRIDFTY